MSQNQHKEQYNQFECMNIVLPVLYSCLINNKEIKLDIKAFGTHIELGIKYLNFNFLFFSKFYYLLKM